MADRPRPGTTPGRGRPGVPGPGTRRIAEPGSSFVYAGTSADRVQGAEFVLQTADGEPVAVPERCEAA